MLFRCWSGYFISSICCIVPGVSCNKTGQHSCLQCKVADVSCLHTVFINSFQASATIKKASDALFSGCPSMYYKFLTHLINCWCEVNQICSFGTFGHKDELIRFWVQKVKGQSHSKTTYGQISTLGDIFSPVSVMHRHILMKLVISTHYQVCMTLMTRDHSFPWKNM